MKVKDSLTTHSKGQSPIVATIITTLIVGELKRFVVSDNVKFIPQGVLLELKCAHDMVL